MHEKPRTLKQLMDEVLKICPNALFETDANGEILICTGYATEGREERLVDVAE